MFCGKCGKPIPDGAEVCPACGRKTPGADSSKPAKPSQLDENKTVYADDQAEPPAEDKTERKEPEKDKSAEPEKAQDGKRPVRSSEPVKPPAKPQFSDPSESARASWSRYARETAPPPPPTPKRAPKPVPKPSPKQARSVPQPTRPQAAPAPKKSGKAGLIIAIVAASLVLVLIAGYCVSRIYYRNSDPYKITQAEQYILDGDIDKGLEAVEKVQGDRADAVREFANLMKCREEYFAAFKPGSLQTSDDPVKACYDKLKDAYSSFSGYDSLPSKLKKRFDEYSGRLAGMSEALTNLKISDLTDAQRCVLAFGERKRGEGFTTGDLENVIRYSDPAVKAIDSGLMQTDGFGELEANSSAAAVKVMQEFFDNVSAQLEQDKFDLNDYLSKGKSGITLKFNVTDPDYQAIVSTSLKPLATEDDAFENSNTLYTALCYAWMAYSYDI